MKRYDIEKRGGHSYGYADSGWKVTQTDETILQLSRAETDLVVLGLILVVQEREKLRAFGLKPEPYTSTTVRAGSEPVDTPQKANPEGLLKAICEPNYVAEANIAVTEKATDTT